jgi:microcystin-dependent protein
MPSTYTGSGIELIGDGEQSGSWGNTTNNNLEIINRLVSEAGTIALAGTTHTLSIADGTLSDGQYAVLVFGGAPSGTNTVTISPNDAQRVFIVKNSSGQSVVLTQGSGGNVTVTNGKTAIVYCDGQGASAAVVNVSEDFVSTTLSAIGALAPTDGNFIVGNGSTWVAESGNTVLQSIGVTATAVELNTMDGVTATTAEINTLDGIAPSGAGFGFIPSGGIILWSGSVASVPSGWFLCNGSNGTPDLRNRFVVGAGDTYAVGATGGADSVTLDASQMPAHTHTFSGSTNTTGAHTHTVPNGNSGGASTVILNGNARSNDTNTSTSSAGDHSHTFSGTTASTGGGTSHENRPPYYALAYIMKA